jgi:hypothetical protein
LPKNAFKYFVGFLRTRKRTMLCIIIIYYKIIINNDVRFQDPILLLKIPIGTRKNFSENYRQFRNALSKKFASPVRDQQPFSHISYD